MPRPDGPPPARFADLIADAWPAAETVALGEWRLRWAWGVTRRANAVIASGDPGSALSAAVDLAEAFFTGRGQPSRFQVSEDTPEELRPLLETRRYREDARTDVQSAPLARLLRGPATPWVIEEDPAPGAEWWSVYSAVEHGSIRHAGSTDVESAFRNTLLRPSAPNIFVTASRDGVTAACGQGIAQGEWLGIQCIATLPEHRRLGAARTVMAALGRWGERRGCRFAYLAVLKSNAAAQHLYRRAGFAPADGYAYLYRVDESFSASDGITPSHA